MEPELASRLNFLGVLIFKFEEDRTNPKFWILLRSGPGFESGKNLKHKLPS